MTDLPTHEAAADTEARHAHRDLLAEKDAEIERLTALLEEALSATDIDGDGDVLLAREADKCLLTVCDDLGWPDGLSIRHHEDDDPHVVAHLDLEDSQYGPMLWDYAISVLKARRALLARIKEPRNDQ